MKTGSADTLEAVRQIAQQIPVIFPAHPRTARNIEASHMRGISMWQGGLLPSQGLWMMAPASYLEFLDLMQHAAIVITDSGGVQEETTFLGRALLDLSRTHRTPGHGHPGHQPGRRLRTAGTRAERARLISKSRRGQASSS